MIIDTNVVVSGVIGAPEPTPPCRIVDAMTGGYLRFLLSEDLLREYRRVLLRPSIATRHGLTEAAADEVLVEIVVNATMREPATSPTGAEHGGPGGERPSGDPASAGDAHVVALLRSMPGSALVTGDKRLADAVRPWAEALTPAGFAATLKGD